MHCHFVTVLRRWTDTIRYALDGHPRIQQTGGKAAKQLLWRLVDDQDEGAVAEQRPRRKRPAPTSTPLLGKNSCLPN